MSLVIWLYFYILSMPLTTQETLVVVGLCSLVSYVTKIIISSYSSKSKGDKT